MNTAVPLSVPPNVAVVAVTFPLPTAVFGAVNRPLAPIVPAVVVQASVGCVSRAAPNWSPAGRRELLGSAGDEAGRRRTHRDRGQRLADPHVHAARGRQPIGIGDRRREGVPAGHAERGHGVLRRVGAVGAEARRRRAAGSIVAAQV